MDRQQTPSDGDSSYELLVQINKKKLSYMSSSYYENCILVIEIRYLTNIFSKAIM